MKNQTFQQFVDESFTDIFNGLTTGGLEEMKARHTMYMEIAARIVANGGFAPA